jgi:lactoylglutathione lyase
MLSSQEHTLAGYCWPGERSSLAALCKEISLLKLNHINLPVTDMEAAALFLETYFGLRRWLNPEQREDDSELIILLDDDGLICTLMQAHRASFPGSFHIGFVQSSEQQVNEIYQRLQADGFQVKPPQRVHAWTFYVHAPGGLTVEVLAQSA